MAEDRAARARHPDYGDIDGMGGLADRLADLASIPSRIARDVADDLNDLMEDGFAAGQDAYGRAWEPLAPRTLRRHGPPPLTHTGEMRSETVARPTAGAGVTLTAPFPAGIHMTGGDSCGSPWPCP